jgi:hypothetical protein
MATGFESFDFGRKTTAPTIPAGKGLTTQFPSGISLRPSHRAMDCSLERNRNTAHQPSFVARRTKT